VDFSLEPSSSTMPPWVDKRALVASLLAQCSEPRRAVLRLLEDTMMPLHEWPEQCIRAFLAPHLGYNGVTVFKVDNKGEPYSVNLKRYDFICFLLGNGMAPNQIVDWCVAQNGYLAHRESALDVAGIIAKHSKGELAHKQVYVMGKVEIKDPLTNKIHMLHGQKQACMTPHFAFDHVALRMAIPVLDDDGAQRYDARGEPLFRIEYQEPGSWHWTNAIERLKVYARLLPSKNQENWAAPPPWTPPSNRDLALAIAGPALRPLAMNNMPA
jgi:hypothetical protein